MFTTSAPLLAGTLAVLVSVVGMPHGGLDHLFARGWLRPRLGRVWPLPFLVVYLAVAGLVVAGWVFAAPLTVVLFFLISAVHFGDDPHAGQPANLVEGGMVIWVPLLFRPAEVSELLAWVIPGGDPTAVLRAVDGATPVLWALAAFGVVSLPILGRRAAVRKLAFAVMFAMFPTLLSFAVYFCGWHSTRELAALARQADPNHLGRGLRRVILAAAPMAGLAVAGTAAAALWFASGRELTPVVVQAVFLGLSAVAVPHILLQAVMKAKRVNPFDDRGGPTCATASSSSSAADCKAG
jgi:Brp/Blh family beta-carotene 15,15'-monooxygenase